MILDYKGNARVFKALSDETRLKIIDMLSCGELCACAILESFQITQPTLSYHMKFLANAGIVVGRKEGSWVHYSLDQRRIKELKIFLDTISIEKKDCICKTDGCSV